MIPCLLIHSDISKREEEAEKILLQENLSRNHPDLLWFETETKLGVEQARQIKEFLSLKPYQGSKQAVVIVAAENLTLDAQNALLKTLEEPPEEAIIILGLSSEDQLLSTIISRCQAINLNNPTCVTPEVTQKSYKKIEELLGSNIEQRFKFIEKLEEKEKFLYDLTAYFRHKLLDNSAGVSVIHPGGGSVNFLNFLFLKDLVEAEKWAKQNVNIRAILEYLMLKMPTLHN